jgi:hypothetical protein
MNGGIQPTVELATNNGGYPYPIYYGNNSNGNGFFGGDGIWALVLLALLFNGNNGFGGGFGGNSDFAWLSNGQKDIMTNTNNGFDTLHLSNQLDTVNSGIYSLSNQLCNCCADMNQTVSNGFYNAEISANNRAINQMQDTFALSRQFADCCCENRLGIANLNSTILSENCADRAALADGLKDVLINQTANTQRILDQLCNDKIDAKNEKITDLQRELLMKDLQASQIAQNSFIAQGFANEVDQLYNRLSNCPVPSTPVYGRTPIFTCNNNGCGCNGFNGLI